MEAANPNRKTAIVFADDNRSLLDTVSHLLDPALHELRPARNGMEALCLIAESRPDIVFIDRACPELDGFQLCALLQAREEYRDLPVVLLAEGADLFEQVKARALGARGVLQKPFGRNELLALLEQGTATAVLPGGRGAEALGGAGAAAETSGKEMNPEEKSAPEQRSPGQAPGERSCAEKADAA